MTVDTSQADAKRAAKANEPPPYRAFHKLNDIAPRSDYSLTELNAAVSVDRGFMSHNDWLGHVARYGYAYKTTLKRKVRTILDLGCGVMALPYFMWRNRMPVIDQYWGVDLRAQAAWMTDIGWRTPMTLVRADVTDPMLRSLPDFPGTFDLVTCFETLEHMPRATGKIMLDRLFQYTRPGGLCLLSSPNAGVSNSTAANHLDGSGNSMEWTFDEKIEGAEGAGFEVLNSFGTFCGTTRLPEGSLEDPMTMAAKEFMMHGWFTVWAAAAYPRESNNALHVLRKPE